MKYFDHVVGHIEGSGYNGGVVALVGAVAYIKVGRILPLAARLNCKQGGSALNKSPCESLLANGQDETVESHKVEDDVGDARDGNMHHSLLLRSKP